MIRTALVAFALLAALAGEAECGDRLDLGRGPRRPGDVLIDAMDGAAARAGMDGIVLVSIASVVEDARQISSTHLGNASGPKGASQAVGLVEDPGGLYGFEERTWLKAAGSLITVARSDERPVPTQTETTRRVPKDAALRQLLDMRQDPIFSTQVAATALKAGIPIFVKALGREPSAGEMLVMHLFGPEAAIKVTRAALSDGVTLCTVPLGAAAKRNMVRPFVTAAGGSMLTARAFAVSAEIAMAMKAKIVHRFLDRLRAGRQTEDRTDA